MTENASVAGERQTSFWPVAVLLVAASIVYCLPLFANLDNWGRQDWDQFMFRYATPRLSILRDHVAPTWNPYANGGTVLLAHPDSPVLSPWYLLVLVLGAPIGLRVQVVLFMALGAVGMAAFVARLGATRAGSVVGGLVFMMSSHFVLHIAEGHVEWCVIGLMPWLAICMLHLREGARWVFLAALLLASALTFGAVYIPAVYLPFFTIWVLLLSVRERSLRYFFRWGAVVVVALLLSSVKLIPTVAFARDNPRQVNLDQRTPLKVLLTGLLDPRQALFYEVYRDRELPDGHFARSMTTADAEPISEFLESFDLKYGFHEYGCYIGLAGILLAVWGGIKSLSRLWPLYGAGAFAGIVALGAASPVNLWSAIQQLPLYGQLRVPSRFLAAVLFVLALAAAFGLKAGNEHFKRSRYGIRGVASTILLVALFTELTVLGWSLFANVFTVPSIELTKHADFAQRFKYCGYDLSRGATVSDMYPRLMSNSGMLDAYENLSVPKGAVRATDDQDYRGEAYLENGHGAADFLRWSMSRINVRVAPQGPDNLILNQNYYQGWRARRRDAGGGTDVIRASRSEQGLIAVAVDRKYTEVELYYLPDGFIAGLCISTGALAACVLGLWLTRRRRSAVLNNLVADLQSTRFFG